MKRAIIVGVTSEIGNELTKIFESKVDINFIHMLGTI